MSEQDVLEDVSSVDTEYEKAKAKMIKENLKKYGIGGYSNTPLDVYLDGYDIVADAPEEAKRYEIEEFLDELKAVVYRCMDLYHSNPNEYTFKDALSAIRAWMEDENGMTIYFRTFFMDKDDVLHVTLSVSNIAREFKDVRISNKVTLELTPAYTDEINYAVERFVACVALWHIVRQNVAYLNGRVEMWRQATNPDAPKLLFMAASEAKVVKYSADMLVFGVDHTHCLDLADVCESVKFADSDLYRKVIKSFKLGELEGYISNRFVRDLGFKKKKLVAMLYDSFDAIPVVRKGKEGIAKVKEDLGLKQGDVDFTELVDGRMYAKFIPEDTLQLLVAVPDAKGNLKLEVKYTLSGMPNKAAKVYAKAE